MNTLFWSCTLHLQKISRGVFTQGLFFSCTQTRRRSLHDDLNLDVTHDDLGILSRETTGGGKDLELAPLG